MGVAAERPGGDHDLLAGRPSVPDYFVDLLRVAPQCKQKSLLDKGILEATDCILSGIPLACRDHKGDACRRDSQEQGDHDGHCSDCGGLVTLGQLPQTVRR
jgi:hypothetical protein